MLTIDELYIHPTVIGSFFDTECYIFLLLFRQYPADPGETGFAFQQGSVAGYHSRCPSGKSKTIRFISALLPVKFTSKAKLITVYRLFKVVQ